MERIDHEAKYQLMACPFCGKDVADLTDCQELEACGDWEKCQRESFKAVVCSFLPGGCGASTGFYPTAEEAVDAWNSRSRSAALKLLEGTIEELAERHRVGKNGRRS